MGMAASQARYLALVARKSNCEYEGQQINQARTALANQSANLFNQMLGLQVPVPPSTQDFTKTQYSYQDGVNASTISSWQQLSEADPKYNYVVTHYYYTDRYTGSMKKLSDPQVQFTGGTETDGENIKIALDKISRTQAAYEKAVTAREMAEAEASKLSNYYSNSAYNKISNSRYDSATDTYTFEYGDTPDEATFVGYDSLYTETVDPNTGVTVLNKTEAQEEMDAAIEKLVSTGALDPKYLEDRNKSDLYYCNGQIAFKSDLSNLYGGVSGGTSTSLNYIDLNSVNSLVDDYKAKIDAAVDVESDALDAYNNALGEYEALSIPKYVGNSELTPLATLTDDQLAEIEQIISDMKEQEVDASIENCFNGNGEYIGGIYSFKMNGTTYYTTYQDLAESYSSGTGNNNIDGQLKMAYYNATYISTKVETTEKALLETDGNGRFSSIRFENDSITYTLNMETVTDDAAYEDAMNQYYYENAKYDKMVQDINAQTSIIHQQDRQLELRLKQLDTEQSALSTEMEAVKKVVDDNVDKSFKTFNG